MVEKTTGSWNKKTIMSQLNIIIDELGHFPSHIELKKMKRSDLIGAISKNGGLVKFREILGYEAKRKPRGYWTEKIIISELEPIIKELGHFPSHNELREMKISGVTGAISGHGGYNYFRGKMGYKPLKISKGHWTDEIIVSELEPIIDELGHFPFDAELRKMGKCDLSSAIVEYGDINYFRGKLGYEPLRRGHKPYTCDIIKKHHDDLKDDPERLSTKFLQNIIGTNC